ncbi:MAG: asnB [Chitinophagaceae bacterium]|nr:asnB [Chitinophagaceae bacterium]
MCGIVGVISETCTEEQVKMLTDTLYHRGPDAGGYYSNSAKNIFLGHRRLSILDLSSSANQPFYSRCKNFVIVFNGEVYNYQELATKYKLQLSTTSDTEVIVELFALLGKECVHEFNGMFSFAIYDINKEEIFLCRDRLGVKPLFVYQSGKEILFASELKALTALDRIASKLTIDKKAVGLFLHLAYIPQPHSIYNEITKFPAGSYAWVSRQGIDIHSYWRPEDKVEDKVIDNYATAKQQLKELLQSSIRYRMISDVPFGTFLSGGTDSSLVTAIAQEQSSTPLKTFSIGFKEFKLNETIYAQKVASYLKTDHEQIIVSEKDAMESIEEIMEQFDEPFADSSALPTYLVSKMSSQKVKMVLTGDGGDELFMGYGAYSWAERFSNKGIYSFRKAIAATLNATGNNRFKRIAQVLNYNSATDLRSHIYSQEQYYFSETELSDLLMHHKLYNPGKWIDEAKMNRRLTPKEQQAFFDLTHYLKDDLLVKVDRTTMYNSIEAREPLLDYRLVEFALNLSQSFKYKKGIEKYILKEVLYEYVPKTYFDRPKWGFGIPLSKWLSCDLKFLMDKYLSEEQILKYQVLNLKVVQSLVQRYMAGEEYLSNRVWLMIILQKWLHKNHINV